MSQHPQSSPFRVSVRDIARRPGTQRTVSDTFPAPAVLGTDVIGVPEGADLRLDVSLESVSEGIWVSGTVSAEAVGVCGRCLDEVRQQVAAPVQGLFTVDAAHSDDEDGEPEDVFQFDGENVDLEEVVRDAVASQLPFTPLCRPDCPGLCDQCGARLEDDPDHSHDMIDPRWSALTSLTEQEES